eukprot:4139412-Alexandrium_andersonii.AAC.1
MRLARFDWPVGAPAARVHASPSALLALSQKRGAVGAPVLFRESEIIFDEACGAFRGGNDAPWDRLILNPTVINGRCWSISWSTKRLGQGFLLTRLSLSEGEWLEISTGDLREMYYTFRVSRPRAKRAALRASYPASAFEGF